jgi:cytochrome c-type biogenesis protein CcmH
MNARTVLALLLWMCATVYADPVPLSAPTAAAERGSGSDPVFEARLRTLEMGLRCMVCQNESLADSGAGLAEDMRREVRSMALAGKSDNDIRTYLHERYGDFIFFRPPVKPETWLLWFGPFVLLIGMILYLLWRQRRVVRVAPTPFDPDRVRQIEKLLTELDEA